MKRTGERWFGLAVGLLFLAVVWLTFPKNHSGEDALLTSQRNVQLQADVGLEIDDPVPNLHLKDLGGVAVDLRSVSERRTVLLTLWTTGCGRCLEQLRVVEKMAGRLKQVEVLTVNRGESSDAIKDFLMRQDLKIRAVADEAGGIAAAFGPGRDPTTYVLKQGRIVGLFFGALTLEQLEAKIAAVR